MPPLTSSSNLALDSAVKTANRPLHRPNECSVVLALKSPTQTVGAARQAPALPLPEPSNAVSATGVGWCWKTTTARQGNGNPTGNMSRDRPFTLAKRKREFPGVLQIGRKPSQMFPPKWILPLKFQGISPRSPDRSQPGSVGYRANTMTD